MPIKRLFVTITILFCLLLSSFSQAQQVSIPDANLAAAVRQEIGNSITRQTLLNLTRLDAPNRGIKNLTGLEHARNLRELNLGGEWVDGEGIANSNTISDFSPIAGLTRLTLLNLSFCGISDVSFVSGLIKLTWLDLGNNIISDISSLANLKQLNQLYLWDNNISDVSPLANLTKLTWLMLNDNSISDVSPLAELKKLPGLGLSSNSISDISPLAELTQLTDLYLGGNTISDIAPLATLKKLNSLDLSSNTLSDISPLTELTQLTELWLVNNCISDVSPIVELNLIRLSIESNPLSYASINLHIPAMQAKGVEVAFDNRTQTSPIVRLIYFRPRDRQPQPDIDVQLDTLIKEVQQFYADEMERHGYGRKTFQFETDADGNAVVYHVIGKLEDTAYHDEADIIWDEIYEQFDRTNYIYLTALDVSSELIGTWDGDTACGVGGGSAYFHEYHGRALLPASGGCFDFGVAAHELGHAFGLPHDFRNDAYIMSYGAAPDELSKCAAEWLDVHWAFNPNPITCDTPTTIEMLPPSLASPPNAIRLRFQVTAPDGVHQVQLLAETLSGTAKGLEGLIACKHLNREPSTTVEFVTTSLVPANTYVSLQVIDTNGNFSIEVAENHFSTSKIFPIDVTSLLLPPKVVSIPDPNLATAIRQEIGDTITTHTLLNLTRLETPNRGITDLTGLEHAHNLRELNLGGEYISGEGRGNSNAISDYSPLAKLANLRKLNLSQCALSDISFLSDFTQPTELSLNDNSISDISPLIELKRLTRLDLRDNIISDISPLTELKTLTWLGLDDNIVSDVSPLAELKELIWLWLGGNIVSDLSPLANLTQLNQLYLNDNIISDISSLANLTQLNQLYLWNNAITDISALANLTQLNQLYLGGNTISDISSLANLTQLGSLGLDSNAISDVSPLAGLKKLAYLGLNVNNISDVSPLAELKQLTELSLNGNTISDISSLAKLTKLTRLILSSNNISDVSPLIALNLAGTEWDSTGLDIRWNPLSDASINTHIPAMQAKGIIVAFDDTEIAQEPVVQGETVAFPAWDVNEDGITDATDAMLVVTALGQESPENPRVDVNGDGVVDGKDLALVAEHLGEGEAPAAASRLAMPLGFTLENVEHALNILRAADDGTLTFKHGIANLERLLSLFIPERTALLHNYPNPFNPETWIPYQLAKSVEVTLHIYAVNGTLVRTLAFGHQPAGVYRIRSRAAYWDGRNLVGEAVASGIYFYTLTAGDYTATRKMLIRK